mmetsp:Transcript_7775/g.48223  ORF Transcript_7775/g.48223 Transcript_7775/m.48223 type:complete len:93 (+) Transcript_7775:26-304(+)
MAVGAIWTWRVEHVRFNSTAFLFNLACCVPLGTSTWTKQSQIARMQMRKRQPNVIDRGNNAEWMRFEDENITRCNNWALSVILKSLHPSFQE